MDTDSNLWSATIDRAVIDVWSDSGRTQGTIAQYLSWVRRFRTHCAASSLDPRAELTRTGAAAFGLSYMGPRMRRPGSAAVVAGARGALHAWSYALRVLGQPAPEWMVLQERVELPAIIAEYRAYRLDHRGVASTTLRHDTNTALLFTAFLRGRKRSLSRARVVDVDAFVSGLSKRLSPRSVSRRCTALRSFFRFLQATGRLRHDLAASVVSRRQRSGDRPPRALPWPDVQRLLRAVKQDRSNGRRDFALLLLMATLGLGGAEVAGLRLEDIDWRAGTLSIRRPKTGSVVLLPLRPMVSRAVAAYLRRDRPSRTTNRAMFVTKALPHRSLSCSAIRHVVRKHAEAAGITARPLGAHLLRHSFAARQVDIGIPPKVLSDILGHRRPSSTSVYVQVAIRRLRQVGLPVPR